MIISIEKYGHSDRKGIEIASTDATSGSKITNASAGFGECVVGTTESIISVFTADDYKIND